MFRMQIAICKTITKRTLPPKPNKERMSDNELKENKVDSNVPKTKQKQNKMKKAILFLMAFMTPLLVLAQAGVGIGIKAGANFTDQEVTHVSTKTVTDFHVGAYINLNFSEKFGITPEVLYSANGSQWEDVKVDYDYISLPVMLRIMPAEFLSLEAGPQFSFLTKAEVEGIGDVKDQLKTNDFGLAFGVGLHTPIGLNVGARYVYGFTDISNVSGESIKNRTFQVYLGWTILGAN